jgi:glycosyltransferase involved in cell wall biosynthesis
MIVGLFHRLLENGGVHQAGRLSAAALTILAERQARTVRILTLNDPLGDSRIRVGTTSIHIQGFGRQRHSFAAAALGAAARAESIYFSHPYFSTLAPPMRALRPRLPIWIAAHGTDVSNPLSRSRRFALRFATGVLPVSVSTAQNVMTIQGVSPTRVHVVPNALDPDFEARAARGASSAEESANSRTILTVARLSTGGRKGVDTIINVLANVAAEIPDAKYVVIGDGDDRQRLVHLAETTAPGRVLFVGALHHDALADRYRSCDVFAMPSVGEAFGIVYLEAMAFAKPVIAANSGGAPEVVTDGETGILVDPGDRAALTQALVRLLRDERLRDRMGAAGRERVLRYFTFDGFVRQLESILIRDNAARRD